MISFTVLQSVYHKDNPQFLHESLQSIADNTLQPDRVVLVKDGVLTPELECVIESWRGKLPLEVVGYEENRGLGYALNYGLQFVRTELVARMDSDDICMPDRFEKQVLQFELNTSLAVLGTGIEEFYADSGGTEYQRVRLYPKKTDKHSRTLYKGTPLAHPTVMMRTALLKKYGYSERTACNEDIELWFRLLHEGYVLNTLQEPLLRFRITEGTFARRHLCKAWNEYRLYMQNLHTLNGISRGDVFVYARFISRLLPKWLNRKLYLSQKRAALFEEKVMVIQMLSGCVFMKAGHLFEALCEYEENGIQMLQAKQLDTDLNTVVELPAAEVVLYKTGTQAEIRMNIQHTASSRRGGVVRCRSGNSIQRKNRVFSCHAASQAYEERAA